jgi:hypothetical protein
MTRTPANDNEALPTTLAALPLFATDQQLAVAIVGKGRAAMWVKRTLPMLEARGFPRFDALHEGRPVALVKKYYDTYLGVNASYVSTGASTPEDPESWVKGHRTRKSTRRG